LRRPENLRDRPPCIFECRRFILVTERWSSLNAVQPANDSCTLCCGSSAIHSQKQQEVSETVEKLWRLSIGLPVCRARSRQQPARATSTPRLGSPRRSRTGTASRH
jgi:hypothetical protein